MTWWIILGILLLGIGATIGSVIATRQAIVPAAVGVDIGCGMVACRLSIGANQLDLLDQFAVLFPKFSEIDAARAMHRGVAGADHGHEVGRRAEHALDRRAGQREGGRIVVAAEGFDLGFDGLADGGFVRRRRRLGVGRGDNEGRRQSEKLAPGAWIRAGSQTPISRTMRPHRAASPSTGTRQPNCRPTHAPSGSPIT